MFFVGWIALFNPAGLSSWLKHPANVVFILFRAQNSISALIISLCNRNLMRSSLTAAENT